jgi:hypothetical protein
MTTAETVESEPSEMVLPFVGNVLRETVQAWSNACRAFFRWEREHIFERDPTPEETEKHRIPLEELLLGTRLLRILVSTASVRDRSLAKALDGRLCQLQESWEIANNPMSLEEAKKLALQMFPAEKDFIEDLSR